MLKRHITTAAALGSIARRCRMLCAFYPVVAAENVLQQLRLDLRHVILRVESDGIVIDDLIVRTDLLHEAPPPQTSLRHGGGPHV